MKPKIIAFAVVFILSATAILFRENLCAQEPSEVLKKMDQVLYASRDQTVKIKMIVTDRNGKESEREAETIQKGNSMRLFRFTSPASQAGIAFLSLPGEVMYLYLPAYGKERRIASHIKNQGFAGTDFSYDDMESKSYADRYNALSLKTEGKQYVLELEPKPNIQTEYGKLIVTLGKQNYYPVLVKYFDKSGKQIKELVNSKIEQKGNYWIATEFEMKDLRKGTKSRMVLTRVEFDKNLSDDEFTVRKLVR